MSELIDKELEIAQSRIGVREIGNTNTGVEVNSYLARVNTPPGNPWCAAFGYTNLDDACQALGVRNPFIRTGYCPDIGAWARTRRILFDSPQRGDHFLQVHGDDFHHTGHVTAVNGSQFNTIEGNTNSNGSREGFEVEAKTRTVGSRFAFVRYILLCAPDNLTRALVLTDHKVCDMPVRDNVSLCSVRKWCAWMHENLVWDASEEPPIVINGQRLQAQISLIDGEAYVPIRALVATRLDLKISFDAATNTVTVTR